MTDTASAEPPAEQNGEAPGSPATEPDAARPPRIAAFFDLDKTVIAKSSALAFSRPFYDGGLINRRSVLKSSYAHFVFLLTAADHDQVEQLRRHVMDMCRGWDVDQVSAIVRETLDEVVQPLVFAEAADLIADHHRRGHDVVLVSASGREVVEPIGELVGADHVRASRMKVVDGRYSGELEFYCHGEEKAVAMNEMADTYGYRLADCYAYSDSITDLPMLAAVGHPVAVNPDRALRKHATEHGWGVMAFGRPIPARERLTSTGPALAMGAAVSAAAVVVGAVVLRHLRSGS
ncbi:HAD family hydrolase [Gordonia sp. ABSL49_1]|uniref:HAD family hydrolase n=1 Tax=unclassified Gordonia (in: high G+C Gram-positive bacteria) TaxID=2657482 RepID=UPI0035B3CFAF